MQGYLVGCKALRNRASRELLGKRLTVRPHGPICKMFFLPNRYSLFESVYQPTAGVESRSAMCGKDRNEDAAFANLETSQAMHDGDVPDGELLKRPRSQFPQLLECHVFIGVVIKIQGPPATAVVSNNAIENDDSAILGLLHRRHNVVRNDAL